MCLETVGRDVEHDLFLKLLLDLYADGLDQMCLSQTGTSVYKKRIVGGVAGIGCDGHAGCSSQAVAVSFYKIVERVVVVEVGIDCDALDAGNDVRIVYLLHFVLGQGYVGIDYLSSLSAGRIPYCGILHHGNFVYETGLFSDDPFHGRAQYADEVLLDVFGKESGGDLNGEGGPVHPDRPDRLKPCPETALRDVVPDDLQTVIPYFSVIHSSKTFVDLSLFSTSFPLMG